MLMTATSVVRADLTVLSLLDTVNDRRIQRYNRWVDREIDATDLSNNLQH